MSDLFGVKPEHAVAGFGGALAYLPFVKQLRPVVVLGVLAGGVTTAAFFTPLVVSGIKHFLSWELGQPEQLGLGFLLGLTATVGLIPFAISAAEWLNKNVGALMARLSGTSSNGNGGSNGPMA